MPSRFVNREKGLVVPAHGLAPNRSAAILSGPQPPRTLASRVRGCRA